MWIDGIPVPVWIRPWVGWVLGNDWPKGDENGLFRLADALLATAEGVARGVDGDGAELLRGIGDSWDGAALRAFVTRVEREVGGRRAALVSRLVGLAVACNDLGVQIQFTRRLMRLTVLMLVVQLVALSLALMTPAGRLALRLMKGRAQVARWTIKVFARRLLLNIALFGGLMGGMDLLVQATQSRRDGVDWKQTGASAGMGALTGGLMTGLAWAMPVRSLWTLMAHSAVAGGGATLVSELLDGKDGVDWTLVLKGMTSGAVGGADAHWGTWSPGGGVKHLGGAAKAFGADLDTSPSPRTKAEPGPEPAHHGAKGDPLRFDGHPADAEAGGARPRPDAGALPHLSDREPGPSAPLIGREPGPAGEHARHTTLAASPEVRPGHDAPRPGTADRGTVDAMINRAVPQDPRPAHQHGDPPTHQPTHQPAAAPERQPTHQQAAAPERQPTHQAAAPEQQHMGARPHASSPDAPPPHPAARQGDGAPPAAPVRFEDSGTTFTGRRAEAPDHPHPGEPGWTARGDNPAGTNPQRETTSVPASPSPAGDGVPHPIVRPAVHQVMLNADRRAPLLPIHTAEDLARLQGDQANRIDPREALRASEWAHLREDAPAYRVEGRSGVNHHDGPVDAEATARKKAELDRSADVTVRRIGVRTGGGTRWVTEIEVKIRWVADLGVTAGKALQLQASAMDGVDLYFNHQHRLSDGSQLHVRLTFEEADGMKVGANEVVTFKPGRGRADQVTWYVSDGPHIHAHELGHHLGLRDEYHDPDYAGRRTLTDGGRVFGANLMGDAHRPHLSTNELMLDHHGHEVPPLAGLMDHHLQSIERLLHRAEAEDRRVDTPGRGEGEGEGAGEGVGEAGIRLRADELSRANHVAGNLSMPPHLADLLHRYPHESGDLLDHLRALDHADWIYEGDVTGHRVKYVKALHDSMRAIYGALPSNLDVKDVQRLHHLVRYLGGSPVRDVPDSRWILERAAAALGDGAPVTPREIEGLSRLAEWNTPMYGPPEPYEAGPKALHRAAGEFFGKPGDAGLTRRVTELFASAAEHSKTLAKGWVDHITITNELIRLRNGPGWGRVADGKDFAQMVDRLYGVDTQPGGSTASPAREAGPGGPRRFPPNHRIPPAERWAVGVMLDDWGARPFALDPEDAVTTARSEAQRAHADVLTLRAADPGVARVEQRRFEGYDAAGERRHITEYTVRIKVSSPLSTSELGAFNARLQKGLDEYVNGRHRTADGDQLHVRVQLERAGGGGATVAHGDHTQARGPLDFRTEAPTLNLVRQVVRQLGMEVPQKPAWLDSRWADGADLVRHDTETARADAGDGSPSEAHTSSADAGSRAPLVAGGEMREALRQEHAYALDPRKTVGEDSLAAARQGAEAHVVTSTEAYTVEARRMQARGADGTLRRVTEFTLTLRYGVAKDLAPQAVLKIFSDVRDAVDLHFNHQHRLPVDGSQLHVRVRFEQAPAGAGKGERVELTRWVPSKWQVWAKQPVLGEMAPLNLHAQKIGQLLGLELESLDQVMRKTARVVDVEGPARDGSLMGAAVVQWATRPDRGWAGVHDLQRLAVPEIAGLRDRHLWTLNEHLIREDVPEPVVPLDRVPAGEPVQPTPWARTDPERGVVPNHIRILLKRFPVEGSWLEHVRLLDRVVTLFGNDRVGDRLGFNAVTHEHLRYTGALSDLAAEVYGTHRDHSFNAEELIRLHGLTVWLGRGPYEALPDGGWLRDAVNDLLGRPADRPLTEKDVHFLGGLASRHDRTPFHVREERSPAALLERARQELDRAPLTVRVALDDAATPLEREAARWGDRGEEIVEAAPRELPAGETLRDVLRSGTADPGALEAWLRRVAEVEYPGAGVRAELGEWSLVDGRLSFSLYYRSVDGQGSRGLPLAMAQYVVTETADGRLVAAHFAPSLAPSARPVDVQRVRMAWTRWSRTLDDAYIAVGVSEIRYPQFYVLKPLDPP
ncbi:hypothetical protein [Nonomuraea roseoviolacea]|uniref:Outer membrane channel protein CpnT-like N-terminal domain-containing protein n=1 Tax=Nonomuraea roseoviolacea subsp. carminata TaxID=160689 RepID=A0ABT1JW24_9ACTN|nr:hypothetical protein [Nonomuraea roseoviolacea]MCP2345956.1 hypothetical protein [Nonomuraea roseoviolacea subsp. carminata]